ncbi:hypothetical protein V1525DRAFT_427264 [Lipomyces kononenkoae]|uniref:Uncharacterized protein n=1 Tax=Lipomyces kononenkoae TaxID=34357 RepID=A0ACC3SXW6_LIPKO
MISSENSQQQDKERQYAFARGRALTMLLENEPERRLDIQLPYEQYLKYPYLAYNSATETVTVVTVPYQIHEVAGRALAHDIVNETDKYFSVFPNTIGRIEDIGSSTTREWMVTIEVGFSEKYRDLCRDKNLWIEGNHVKVCVLVIFRESPRFRTPRTPCAITENIQEEIDRMTRHVREAMNEKPWGPISYKGHTWVGQITDMVIEVWRAGRSQPDKFSLVGNGVASESLPSTIGLTIRDFFPEDFWASAGIPDAAFCIALL